MNKFILFSFFLSAATSASTGGGKLAKFIGDEQFTSNVYELNSRAGVKAAPKDQPWSGTFWPLRSGSTGNPYSTRLDGSFAFTINQIFGAKANIRTFQRRISHIRSQLVANKLDARTIDNMAPSEKYDLYLGDHDFTYTYAEWQSVSEQMKYIGEISLWEGSCHGWATAAINQSRPAHVFSVMSLDGKYVIPFYPDDLKALATRLWANSLVQDYTVAQGMRCTSKHPKTDPFTGKVLDIACEGVNPGDFHVSVLELVGGRKESFVVNRSNTRQVWNQPVAGYELNYFNPATEKDGDLAQSVISKEGYADPYHRFRSDAVKSIVGVEMKLKYISETSPSHAKKDEPKKDLVQTMSVRYDLELDKNYQIIGGEWRNKKDPVVPSRPTNNEFNDETADIPQYPGFLWKFADAHPVAFAAADSDIPGNDPTKVSAEILIAASKKAAHFRYYHYNYDANGNSTTVKRAELRPQPLGKVVNALFDLAK